MIKHTLTATTYEDVTMLRGHILFLGHHFTYCTYSVSYTHLTLPTKRIV